MDIDALFEKNDTFTANVEINIPGKKKDKRFKVQAEFLYLDQDVLDRLSDGETVEIDGQEVEGSDDAALLDIVLKGWSGFGAGENEIEYSEDNRRKALLHPPVRTPFVNEFFRRLSGTAPTGGRGGKRGRRKNS